ncbi:MAG: PAS domain S-box protein [Sphingobacteriales bacterium]|nr:MAG: PAS domain S-box protein [Sphingobacteriales bacterium]TAF82824.1 MAG: PAS domain S-box protein [Sphingobacteriales bacterium]
MLTKKNKYIIGVVLAVCVLITNQIIIQYFLYKKREDSKIINLAGRQRMLSQKLNLQYLDRLYQDTLDTNINKTFARWQLVHLALLNGDKKINIRPVKNIVVKQALIHLTQKIKLAGSIIRQKPNPTLLKLLKQNQAQFLITMDGIVNHLELEANKKLDFLIVLEIILCLLSVSLIVLEVFVIYKPILRKEKQALIHAEATESKLRAILDSTTDCNIFISPSFKIINFNKAAQKALKQIFGKEITIDEDFRPYIAPGREENFLNKFNDCLKGEIVSSEYNFDSFGFDIWFCNTFYPVYNNSNHIIGVTFNTADITQRKKAEFKIEAQVQKLKEIAWEQSHTIRRPLANILGLTKLLIDKPIPQTAYENEITVKLLHELEHLDNIITDIVKKID